MGRQSGNIFRTTISVPVDLRKRMNAVKDVNWSAVACRAFESELAEIASRRVKKTMEDLIQRLRASKQESGNEQYKQGDAIGEEWATSVAEAQELGRLERLRDRAGRDWSQCLHGPSAPLSTAEWLYVAMHPEDADRSDAQYFWESAIVDDAWESLVEDVSFLDGFVHGALRVWLEVKDQL